MQHSYPKKEKLKSKILIDRLFAEGLSVSAYPLRLIFVAAEFEDDTLVKTGVSVSKRKFKNAVDRNHIKRLLRESYRLNKATCFNNLKVQHAFMILYIGQEKPTFSTVDMKMKVLFEKFQKKIALKK